MASKSEIWAIELLRSVRSLEREGSIKVNCEHNDHTVTIKFEIWDWRGRSTCSVVVVVVVVVVVAAAREWEMRQRK